MASTIIDIFAADFPWYCPWDFCGHVCCVLHLKHGFTSEDKVLFLNFGSDGVNQHQLTYRELNANREYIEIVRRYKVLRLKSNVDPKAFLEFYRRTFHQHWYPWNNCADSVIFILDFFFPMTWERALKRGLFQALKVFVGGPLSVCTLGAYRYPGFLCMRTSSEAWHYAHWITDGNEREPVDIERLRSALKPTKT